eukprot:9455532-Pyramimonas_sp.AAC.1
MSLKKSEYCFRTRNALCGIFRPRRSGQLREKMKAWTAHGIDRLGPREFLLLSDECLVALDLIWARVLQRTVLPAQ